MAEKEVNTLPVFYGNTGTLVGVDLQSGFLNLRGMPKKKVIQGALIEIERAIELGWAIVLLEYGFKRFGQTVPEILRAVEGYEKCTIARKRQDSGSAQILKACVKHNFDMELFRLFGVQAGGCVYSTAAELREACPNARIEVAIDASGSTIKDYNWFCYSQPEVAGVVLMNQRGEIVTPGRREDIGYRYSWEKCG